MIMFYVAAKFLNASFYAATSGVYVESGSAMRFMQKLVYSFMYVALIYSAANMSFKMIEHIPRHAMKWMGGSASEESYDDHGSFLTTAGAVGGAQLINQFQSLPQTLMSPLSKAGDGIKSFKDGRKNKKDKKEAEELSKDRHSQLLAALSGRNPGNDGGDDTPDPTPTGSTPSGTPPGSGGTDAVDPSLDNPAERPASQKSMGPAADGNRRNALADVSPDQAQGVGGSDNASPESNPLASGDAPGPLITRQASGTQPRQQVTTGQPNQPRLAPGIIDSVMSRIRSSGGLSQDREQRVLAIVSSRIANNPNDTQGAYEAGMAERDKA